MLAQELAEGRIDLALIVNPMHAWARAGPVNRAAIPKQRFVLAESRSYTKRLIDEFMRREGIAIQPFIEIGNEEVIKELVQLDIGVGIFPAWIAADESDRGLLWHCLWANGHRCANGWSATGRIRR